MLAATKSRLVPRASLQLEYLRPKRLGVACIMRGENNDALAGMSPHKRERTSMRLRIEPAKRFVEQHELAWSGKGARQLNAAPLPARKLAHGARKHIFWQQLASKVARLLMCKARARKEQDVVDDIKILDKTRTLEHHRTSPGGILDSSAKRVLQLRHGAQEGRFARA